MMRCLGILAVAMASVVSGYGATAEEAPKAPTKIATPSKSPAPNQMNGASPRRPLRLATQTPRTIVVIHGVQY